MSDIKHTGILDKVLPSPKIGSPFNSIFKRSKKDFLNNAVAASIVIHAGLLFLNLVAPHLPATKNVDSPLEISLVNTRSLESPEKADFLAQHNLRGGGDSEKHAFTTPLPAIKDGDGELIRLVKKQEDISDNNQKQLLSAQSEFNINQQKVSEQTKVENQQNGRDNQTINQEIAKLEAEINQQIQRMAKRPKRMPLTAANAKSVVYANYYDKIRKNIEEYGTTYFPKDNQGNPIYGDLILIIRINKQGTLGYNKNQYYATGVEVARSSGNKLLDSRAVEIAKACAPFGAFSSEMSASIDILEVISTFKFNKQGFATTLQGR
jgi:periplasmic protein TonB